MNEKIKNAAGIGLILLLVTASYGIFQYVGTFAQSAGSSRTFSVTGDGKAVGIPDIAQFSYGVLTQGGTDIASLQDQNSKKGNDIIALLKASGIDQKDIQTQGYSIEPRYQNLYCPQSSSSCHPPEIVGYTVTQNVSVKIRDFSKISGILSGVAEKGANSVSQLSFKIDDPTNLQNDAKNQAIEKAKAQAFALAKAGGFRVGRLLSMSVGNYYPQPLYSTAMGKGGAEVSSAPTIEPGSQEITANVSLTYEIW